MHVGFRFLQPLFPDISCNSVVKPVFYKVGQLVSVEISVRQNGKEVQVQREQHTQMVSAI